MEKRMRNRMYLVLATAMLLVFACNPKPKDSRDPYAHERLAPALIHEVSTPNPDDGTYDLPDPDIMARGRKVYDTYCSACHMGDGKGVPGMNPSLSGTEWINGDKIRLIKIVLQGMNQTIEIKGITYEDDMPAHSFLSNTEVALVLTFVRNSFGNQSFSITEAEVAALRSPK